MKTGGVGIWLFARHIAVIVLGLGMIGSYFWNYKDYSYLPPDVASKYQQPWKLYGGIFLACVGAAAMAFRYWWIRTGRQPLLFRSSGQTPEKR